VTIVTERAVFKLSEGEVVLVEIAPGIDLDKDILNQMQFRPQISSNLKIMDERIFRPGPMNCF
jgi:propionate CoA-transferase